MWMEFSLGSLIMSIDMWDECPSWIRRTGRVGGMQLRKKWNHSM